MSSYFILHESSVGYFLFETDAFEEISQMTAGSQKSITDFSKFGQTVRLKAQSFYTSQEDSLINLVSLRSGICSDHLSQFLETNLPQITKGKKMGWTLGVVDSKLGSSITEDLKYPIQSDSFILELDRGIRLHLTSFVPELKNRALDHAQLASGHQFSRSALKLSESRNDSMVVQSSASLDHITRDLNTDAMKLKEWYGVHFPELALLVTDNLKYAKLVLLLNNRKVTLEGKIGDVMENIGEQITAIVEDVEITEKIVDASRSTVGTDLSEGDISEIVNMAELVVTMSNQFVSLTTYLNEKLMKVAPNLTAYIGSSVAAKLIAKAGTVLKLSKFPASTIQVLGAEKALFRAIKTKSATPKYGLIYNSQFITKAGPKDKGKIARHIANRIAIAVRIDCFSDPLDERGTYGLFLRQQTIDRLSYLAGTGKPTKNREVMAEAKAQLATLQANAGEEKVSSVSKKSSSVSKKSTAQESEEEESDFDYNSDSDSD